MRCAHVCQKSHARMRILYIVFLSLQATHLINEKFELTHWRDALSSVVVWLYMNATNDRYASYYILPLPPHCVWQCVYPLPSSPHSYSLAPWCCRRVEALYNNIGEDADELSFTCGDVMVVKEQINAEWLICEHTGIVLYQPTMSK